MRQLLSITVFALSGTLFAADPASPSIGKILDQQLTTIEKEAIPLVEAMPADKFGFAPTGGEFKGVRTFAQQATHIAAVVYAVSSSVLGEKNPTEMGSKENGPAALKTKADVVKYMKDAFAYGHKAMASITDQNATGLVQSAFESKKVPRMSMATLATWHSFDHYGQMVVYARMNGIVPPASR
jgi:DinB superfamily